MCISRRTLAVLACAFVVCVGCQNTIFVASEGAYVDTKVYPRGTPFRIATSNTFWLCWGQVPRAKVVHVDRLVSRALGKDVKIITGLRITQLYGLGSLLGDIFLGVVSPRTLVIEGAYHEQVLPTSPVP